MMTGKDRLRQIVKASLAGLAQVALPLAGGRGSLLPSNLQNYHSLDNRHRLASVGRGRSRNIWRRR